MKLLSIITTVVAVISALLITAPSILIFAWKRIKKSRNQYLNSEKYYYAQVKKSIRSGDAIKVYNSFYLWLGKIYQSEKTIVEFAKQFGNENLTKAVVDMNKSYNKDHQNIVITIQDLSQARRNYFKHQRGEEYQNKPQWINP